ncbi:hypothetical protein CRN79_03470 [Serratia fonticola]|uniref:winged helix-turn-helix domain-containing protein n=1 Tax=Serratia fonticola TaxID=47917 RepID=UPI000BFDCEB3|nr:helix-turn-helix domain-containing protein [Serratia fonticola]ATM74962.1 hypothetical protein CRN79_03470 [Serratia fonticola]
MELYGFLIDDDIQLDIANKRLIRVSSTTTERGILLGAVELNESMVRLLICLLKHATKNRVSKSVIFQEVWEDNNLTGSSQLLWQTIKSLRYKLESIGIDSSFVTNVRGKGYTLKSDKIIPLFM